MNDDKKKELREALTPKVKKKVGRPLGKKNGSPRRPSGRYKLIEISREFTAENIKTLAAARFGLKEIAAFFQIQISTLYNYPEMIEAYHQGNKSLEVSVNTEIIKQALSGNFPALKHLDERMHGKVKEVVQVEDLREQEAEDVPNDQLLEQLVQTSPSLTDKIH